MKVLKKSEIICKRESSEDHVGIQTSKNQMIITFPKVFPLEFKSTRDRNQAIKTLILVIEKYRNKLAHENSYIKKEEFSEGANNSFIFKVIIEIIEDYLHHGILINSNIVYKQSKRGRVDFGKTFKKIQPVLSNGNMVYLDFITRNTKTNEIEPISIIHKNILIKCISLLGWMYPNLQVEPSNIEYSKAMNLRYLSQELNRSFSDRKKKTIINLIEFIKGFQADNEEMSIRFLKVKRFEYVWEDMLLEIFSNTITKDFYSNSSWWRNPNVLIKHNPPVMPDIIYRNNDHVYVLDAKYYSYSNNNYLLPSTKDINKQIAYSEAIKKKFYCKKVIDVFILPSADTKEVINYFGYATSEFMGNKKVHGITMDIYDVMKKYSLNLSAISYRSILHSMLAEK